MQKRHINRHHSDDRLPLTAQDIVSSGAGTASKTRPSNRVHLRRKHRAQNRSLQITICSIAVVLFVGFILLATRIITPRTDERSHLVRDESQLPLAEYKSLQYALKHSKLVGLYFAAAWCPVSTPVTERIENILGTELLPPPSVRDYHLANEKSSMSLVYVSSDRSEKAFNDYQGKNWMAVPFQSAERDDLKRHFSVCSKPEVDSLGINRKFEIPTLLIIDAETHTLITASGADDLQEYKENALDHWMDLQSLMRAMEGKYGEGEGPRGSPKVMERKFHHHADSYSSLFA
jgi:hypothetical protein